MKIRLSREEEIETDDISTAELSALHDHLLQKVQEINVRLRAVEHSDTLNQQWYERTMLAKRRMAAAMEKIRPIIAQRVKAERRAANPQWQQFFAEICRERMPDELFEAIYQEAMTRSMAGEKLERRSNGHG